jgi:hypothetical protein
MFLAADLRPDEKATSVKAVMTVDHDPTAGWTVNATANVVFVSQADLGLGGMFNSMKNAENILLALPHFQFRVTMLWDWDLKRPFQPPVFNLTNGQVNDYR